jgi:hypothetical protein
VADALGSKRDLMDIYFLDNTDPDGFDRVFGKIDNHLLQTLVIVVSKSVGTKETRNGMLETEAKFKERSLQFGKHTVAVTGVGSELELQLQVREQLSAGAGKTAEQIARSIDADPEDVFHGLRHLASNDSRIGFLPGDQPTDDQFSLANYDS